MKLPTLIVRADPPMKQLEEFARRRGLGADRVQTVGLLRCSKDQNSGRLDEQGGVLAAARPSARDEDRGERERQT
jgi:hypothetical protein